MTQNEQSNIPNNDGQMYAAVTFSFILIVVGMPLWWHTTQVYRVALPYAEMDSLQPEKVPLISTVISVAAKDHVRVKQIAESITNHFSKSTIYNITVRSQVVPETILGSNNLKQLETEVAALIQGGVIRLVELPSLQKFTPLGYLLENGTIFFSSDADVTTLIEVLEREIFQEEESSKRLLQTWVKRTPSSRHFAPEPAYDVLITVLHPSAGTAHVQFDVVSAIQEYLEPFARELDNVCKLHVKSQWLHFVNLQPSPLPTPAADKKSFILPQSSLPHLITPLEKKLGFHVAARPVINLVLWVPSCEWSPLHIHTDAGDRLEHNAFISPRWGAIQIYNPPFGSCDVNIDGQQVMQVFIHQLRILLGLPSVPHGTISKLPITPWEKNALIRRRTLEFVSSAKHTLKSLSELLGKISNIVINDEVGGSIFAALDSVYKCEAALAEGDLHAAHDAAVAAHIASETAFTAPSLLALLYFPEDQKYAVYIPLFLPVMIPVLISFKPMREWLLSRWKDRKTKTD